MITLKCMTEIFCSRKNKMCVQCVDPKLTHLVFLECVNFGSTHCKFGNCKEELLTSNVLKMIDILIYFWLMILLVTHYKSYSAMKYIA